MAATDIVQRVNEAVVAALDTREGLCDLTRQSRVNLVPWRDNLEALLTPERDGLVAYHVVTAVRGGGAIGDWRRLVVSFLAVARTESAANALCEQVEQGFTCAVLAALGTPLDARVDDVTRQPIPPDADTTVHVASVDVTIAVKR